MLLLIFESFLCMKIAFLLVLEAWTVFQEANLLTGTSPCSTISQNRQMPALLLLLTFIIFHCSPLVPTRLCGITKRLVLSLCENWLLTGARGLKLFSSGELTNWDKSMIINFKTAWCLLYTLMRNRYNPVTLQSHTITMGSHGCHSYDKPSLCFCNESVLVDFLNFSLLYFHLQHHK